MCHRIAQAWDIAKLLRGAVERGRFVIGVRSLSTPSNCRRAISTVTRIR
jgi:hypothetical protein